MLRNLRINLSFNKKIRRLKKSLSREGDAQIQEKYTPRAILARWVVLQDMFFFETILNVFKMIYFQGYWRAKVHAHSELGSTQQNPY